MVTITCPKCKNDNIIKSGFVKNRQRYLCKDCSYSFTVLKEGKKIDAYFVVKALQLYIEGISLREIERILGISHVSVLNWIRKYKIKAPENYDYHPTYKVLSHDELIGFFKDKNVLKNAGCIVTELGDKYMVIKWERFKKGGFV